jgi:hypothetical protein
MRDYGVVHTKFWTEPDVLAMSERGRLLFLYLLTGPHTTASGCFRLPLAYIAADLGWELETVCQTFSELSANGFAYHCQASSWVVIPKFLKHNPIANPNCGKAIATQIEQLPQNFSYIGLLFEMLEPFCTRLPNGFLNGLRNRMPNQDQNQKQEQEEERHPSDEGCSSPAQGTPKDGTPSENPPEASEPQATGRDGKETGEEASDAGNGSGKSGKKRPPPDCPHEAIVALYHELLPGNPRVALWDDDRRASLRARWREDPARRSLAWWRDYFARVARSDFLTGRKPGKGGPFYPDLEWLVGPRNMGKVLNGRFDNRGPNTGSAQTDRNMQTAMEWAMETRQ